MNETMEILFGLFGGLALFLFGMNLMSESLQKAAGERMKKVLGMLTSNPVKGVLAGAIATAVLQSSSATTVMAIGFVSAGLMSLPQAISVVFGANIGTTMTAQLIAFNISDYIYPIIAVGFFLSFLSKKEQVKNIGLVLFSFGVLFLGIETMGSVMKPLANSAFFVHLIEKVSDIPVLGVVVGTLMTLVVQSSSATIAVLQNFAAQPIGATTHSVIGLEGAIPILLGDNIGTTITAILASLGQSRNSKRVAIAHSIFNISGSLLFIWFIHPYANLIRSISPSGAEIQVISRQIANAHTGFNLTMTLLWTPLIGLMVAIVMKLIPEKKVKTEDKESKIPLYLDNNVLNQPSVALHLVSEETIYLGNLISDIIIDLKKIKKDKITNFVAIHEKTTQARNLYMLILNYLNSLNATGALTEEQSSQSLSVMYVISEMDRIRHMSRLLIDIFEQDAKENIEYSQDAINELLVAIDDVQIVFMKTLEGLAQANFTDAETIRAGKETIINMTMQMQKHHFERLKKGVCSKEYSIRYTDIISYLERMSSNCINIAEAGHNKINLNSFIRK